MKHSIISFVTIIIIITCYCCVSGCQRGLGKIKVSPVSSRVRVPVIIHFGLRDAVAHAADVTVTIDQGVLNGASHTTKNGTQYYSFRGIPYAKAPVGELRFLPPQEPDSWDEPRDASKFGSSCWQSSGGDENCLFINVHTPKLPEGENAELLPVMVWIHGGAFVSGHGNLDPGHMIDENIVVAAINYRLNVFGFLSLEGTPVSGNAGLKDQSFALRWVQNNIAKFGGDPSKVMILGSSAGGASIHYQVLSPMSKGLFVAADAESGSALNPWAFHYDTQPYAFRLGTILGKTTEDANELIDFLRTVPAKDLENAIGKVLQPEERTRYISNPFVPTVDFAYKDQERFLTDTPRAMMDTGNFNKVNFLTGVTLLEGKSFVGDMSSQSYWDNINNDIERIVPEDLFLAKGSKESLEVAGKVKSFYFGDETPSPSTQQQWIDLQTDLLFSNGVQTSVHKMAQTWTNVYNYQFVYNNAAHAVQGGYVFYTGDVSDPSNPTVKVVDSMVTLWTNVLKNGKPGTDGDVTWEPVTSNSFPFLKIDKTFSIEENLENDRMNFWFDIYANYSNNTHA